MAAYVLAPSVPHGEVKKADEQARDTFKLVFSSFAACHNLYSVARKLEEDEIDTLGEFHTCNSY